MAAQGSSVLAEKKKKRRFNPGTITTFPNQSRHSRIKPPIPEEKAPMGSYFATNAGQQNHMGKLKMSHLEK